MAGGAQRRATLVPDPGGTGKGHAAVYCQGHLRQRRFLRRFSLLLARGYRRPVYSDVCDGPDSWLDITGDGAVSRQHPAAPADRIRRPDGCTIRAVEGPSITLS